MKKAILILVLSLAVLVTTGIWLSKANPSRSFEGMLPYGVILLLVGFGVFIGVMRLKSIRKGEPIEDELSRMIMLKTSSLSYYVSLFWWLVMMYLSDKVALEAHSLIGAGILGMAVIFLLSWVIFKIVGVSNE
jgi:peptidoglycan/LPS O-acetylase OafA/YrhL